jgi:hypothetical protein
MARNPRIEAILQAWFERDHCHPQRRAEANRALNDLLDVIVGESQGMLNRDQILDSLFSQYKDFRRDQWKASKLQVAQAAAPKQ